MKLRTLLLVVATMATVTAFASNIRTKLYIYGFVASFNDSTVYFTSIQETDSAWIDKKTKFLYSRENYSYQLRDYMRGIGLETPTCVTIYDRKKKKIEKKFTAMKKKYSKNGIYNIKYITPSDFQFETIKPDESEMFVNKKVEKEERKKLKAEAKEKKKQAKSKTKDKQMPPPPGGERPQGQNGNMPPLPPRR